MVKKPQSALKQLAFNIPDDRRVLATDLLLFQEEFHLTVFEACLILGIQYGAWYKITNREVINEPIKDQALCMLLRYYSKHPEKVPKDTITIYDLMAAMKDQNEKITPRRIAIMVGRQAAAAHRYISKKCSFNNYAERLARLLKEEAKRGQRGIKDWEKLVEVEAKNRGVENIWSTGSWVPVGIDKPNKKENA